MDQVFTKGLLQTLPNHLLDLHHQRVSFSFIDFFFLKHILYLIYFFSSYSIRSFWGEKTKEKKKTIYSINHKENSGFFL